MPHSELFRDGQRWPSVTEILDVLNKPYLVPWASRLGLTKLNLVIEALRLDKTDILNALTDEALKSAKLERESFWLDSNGIKEQKRDRGINRHTDLENYIEAVMLGDKPTLTPLTEVLEYWRETNGLSFLAFEKKLIHEILKYHGTTDCIAGKKASRPVVDWKFTGQISDTVPLQLAGYSQVEHSLNEKAEGYCVRFYELAKPAKDTGIKKLKYTNRFTVVGNTWAIEEAYYEDLRRWYPTFNALRVFIYPFLRGEAA